MKTTTKEEAVKFTKKKGAITKSENWTVMRMISIITVFLILSCSNLRTSKTRAELINENCISCHNYNDARSMYKPSISEMRGSLLREILDSILIDSNHVGFVQHLSKNQKDSIYYYIKSWNRAYEDVRVHKNSF